MRILREQETEVSVQLVLPLGPSQVPALSIPAFVVLPPHNRRTGVETDTSQDPRLKFVMAAEQVLPHLQGYKPQSIRPAMTDPDLRKNQVPLHLSANGMDSMVKLPIP